MLANKRPRRAAATEDSLDPHMMTERQQLAFLLRATAPSDASDNSSDSSDPSSSDEDDDPPRRRRPAKRSKTRASRASGTTGKTSPTTGDAPPVIYCGRGRPPKNSIKLPRNIHHAHARPAVRMSPRSHNTRSADAAVAAAIAASLKTDKMPNSRAMKGERKEKQEKTSPSSASDVAMLNSSAGAPFCALCCDLEPFCDAPLFLCPACDQKYPTQQALGRVCMT